jgi:hypothetical protein
MKTRRTLYECSHARVKDRQICCDRGYPLSRHPGNGTIDIQQLAEGRPLAPKICRQCCDFDSMGPPVPEEERGWLKIKEAIKNDRTYREAVREVVA